FGTFLLYMMTCVVAIVAFREHHTFSGFKHVFIPVFGILANFCCMLFYLVGPFMVAGMSPKEPFVALGIVIDWGVYGLIYLKRSMSQSTSSKHRRAAKKPTKSSISFSERQILTFTISGSNPGKAGWRRPCPFASSAIRKSASVMSETAACTSSAMAKPNS